MGAQLSFASLDCASKKKRTKRDVFLAEMAAVVRHGRRWKRSSSRTIRKLARRAADGHSRSR